MKKQVLLPVFLVLTLGVFSSMYAAVSVFVPTDYPTLTEAIGWLNSQTINEDYVINVNAGHTESITEPITLTASGSASGSITIRKDGEGANPVINRTDAGTVSTTALAGSGDAIIRMEGSDYITWDGIDVVASESTIEYGYLTHKPSGTDGCQHIRINDCTVTMNKGTSGNVIGICVGNGATSTSSGTGVTVTADSGRNQYITISGVTVQNVHAGIYCRGSAATGYPDSDVTIGEAGSPNLIQNFGGGRAASTYGIILMYNTNPTVSYNTIDNAGGGGTPHISGLYGIYFSSVISGVLNANYNTIKLAMITSNWTLNYIYNMSPCTSESYIGNSFAAGTISTTGNVFLIGVGNTTSNNTVRDNRIIGTITRVGDSGRFYCYYNNGNSSGGIETITNNNFSNIVVTGTTMFFGICTYSTTSREQLIANNTISNITGGGEMYGIHYGGISDVHDNQIYNITTGASICAMFQYCGTINNYRNTIHNLSTTGSDRVVYGIYIRDGILANIYNNLIYGLQAPGYLTVNSEAIRGIHVAGGTANNIHYNTIYLNYHGDNAYFSSTGLFFYYGTVCDLCNNIIVNKCTAGPQGFSSALASNGSYPFGIGPNSDKNIYYAEIMMNIGGSLINDLARYKELISGRDQSSFWEDVPFLSTAGEIDLHIQPGIPTQVEGNALVLAGFDTDYDNQDRSNSRPDIGADEGVFTAMFDTTEEIVIDDDNTSLPDGVTVSSGGVVPSGLLDVDSGIPALVYTITAMGTRNVTIMKPAGWSSDWFCWIAAGNQLFDGANPIPSQTDSFIFEYVDFDAKGTAVVVINDNQTLPVELSSFTATVSSDLFVTLHWVTESETNHAGYNIYRAENEELSTALKINSQLIDSGVASGTQLSYIYSDYEAYNNMHYYYWLESTSLCGSSQFFGPIGVVIGNPEEEPELPGIQLSTKLMNAFPNPFNPSTTLRYSLKEAGNVRIDVYNVRGQSIRCFNASHDSPGFYQIAWDGRDTNGQLVSSGIYMYRMTSGSYSSTKKMIMVK